MITRKENISKENQQVALKEFTTQLYESYPHEIEQIILFGSMARQDAGEGSDVDVLVVTKSNNRLLKNEITDLAFEIILKYGVDIEPVIFDKMEWARLTKKPTSFVHCVLNEGKNL